MDLLFKLSKEQNEPIEIIYIDNAGALSQRRILVKDIQIDCIRAYCFSKHKPRLFKKVNILSAAKINPQKGAHYA